MESHDALQVVSSEWLCTKLVMIFYAERHHALCQVQ